MSIASYFFSSKSIKIQHLANEIRAVIDDPELRGIGPQDPDGLRVDFDASLTPAQEALLGATILAHGTSAREAGFGFFVSRNELARVQRKDKFLRGIADQNLTSFRSFLRDGFQDDSGLDLALSSNILCASMLVSRDGVNPAVPVSKKVATRAIRSLVVYGERDGSVLISYSLNDGSSYQNVAALGASITVGAASNQTKIRLRATVPPGSGLIAWGVTWELA